MKINKIQNFILALLASVLLSGNVVSAEPYFKAQFVSLPGGKIKFSHGSTIVELTDGTLFCAWYGGSREKGDDVAIYSSRLKKKTRSWSKARVIVDTPGKSEGNPVLFLDNKNVLWLFYQTMYGSGDGPTKQGTGWTTCKVKAITSTDGGLNLVKRTNSY